MRYTLLRLLAPAASLVLSSAALASPNFILILTDDLGWTCLSSRMDDQVPDSKSDYHETPNIDRLAREGMRFTNGYAPAAMCCPSRRSIQFGQTPLRQGFKRFPSDYNPALHPRLTIPLMLKSVNPAYRTAHYGKWDLRAGLVPEQLGYDESDGDTGNHNGDVSDDKAVKWTKVYINRDPKRTETLIARSISFVQRNHAAGTPFFLQLSTYAPHVDIECQKATYEKYLAKPKGRIHSVPGWAGMLQDLDTGIGRLLDEVDRLGLADNTYVILMSDNGGVAFIPPVKNKMADPSTYPKPMRNYPLRGGKWDLFEGGLRVPFIVRGPGIKPGSECDVPVVGWDLLPTLADLAGYAKPLPADLDGGSFKELLLHGGKGTVKRPDGDALYFHRYEYPKDRMNPAFPQSAIRVGDWKLLKVWKTNQLYLFNLKDDLGERTNLAAKYPAKAQALNARLMAYLTRVHAEVLQHFDQGKDDADGGAAKENRPGVLAEISH